MRRLARLAAALWLALALPVAAESPAEAEALDAARRLVVEAHGAMTQPGANEAARFEALREAVARAFDFEVWERFLLGDGAARFSEAQLAEFRALLPSYLARLYANQFGKGLDRQPRIEDARTARRDVLVRAAIPRETGADLPVDWRFRAAAGAEPRVIDFMVAGASFLILKREEFAATLERSGPEGLLAFIRDFVARAES